MRVRRGFDASVVFTRDATDLWNLTDHSGRSRQVSLSFVLRCRFGDTPASVIGVAERGLHSVSPDRHLCDNNSRSFRWRSEDDGEQKSADKSLMFTFPGRMA